MRRVQVDFHALSFVGGALTELVGWQAIFLINAPVGVGLALAAHRIIVPDAAAPRWSGFDLRGAMLATTGLAFHMPSATVSPKPSAKLF